MNHFEGRKRYKVSTFGLTWQDMERLHLLCDMIGFDQSEYYLLSVVDFDPGFAWGGDEDEYNESDKALIKVVNEVMRDANLIGLDYVWFQGA